MIRLALRLRGLSGSGFNIAEAVRQRGAPKDQLQGAMPLLATILGFILQPALASGPPMPRPLGADRMTRHRERNQPPLALSCCRVLPAL